MKPLNEWTEAELRDELFDLHMHAGEAFDELLRRAREAERERCAKECDFVASDMSARDEYRASLSAAMCAARIRGLS